MRENLQFVEITDFSPGIWGHNTIVPNAPLGACHSNSFGCMVTQTGALHGGPKLVATKTIADPTIGAGDRPATEDRMVSLAATLVPGVHGLNTGLFTLDRTAAASMFITWGQFVDQSTGTDYGYRTDMIMYHLDSGSAYTLSNMNAVNKVGGTFYTSPYVHSWAGFCMGIEPSLPVTRHVYGFHNHLNSGSVPVYEIRVFPDPSSVTTDSTTTLGSPSPVAPWYMIAHQGRVVVAGAIALTSAFGTNSAIFAANDLAYYSVRAAKATGLDAFFFAPVEENQSSIEVMHSNSANELFIVKAEGGGAIIRGDLTNPNVLRMPGFHGTHGCSNIPVTTPNGLVYGSALGVCLWNGGQETQIISTQIDETETILSSGPTRPFWDPNHRLNNPINRMGLVGTFAYSHPFVYCPNNWLYDLRHGSWWRVGSLTTPSMAHWQAGPYGNIWSVPAQVDATDDEHLYQWVHTNDNQTGYLWQSQPIMIAQGRKVDVRCIELYAQTDSGSGTLVDITVQGMTKEGTESEATAQFDIAGHTQPVLQRRNAAVSGDSVVLSLTATKNPMIRAIRIGYIEATQPVAP